MWKVDQILSLFAPFSCLGCQRQGNLLCADCQHQVIAQAPQRCYRCFLPTYTAICFPCRLNTPLDRVNVAASYKDQTSQLIGRLKFARTQAAGALIAKIMDRRLPLFPAGIVMVHIPTSSQRVRQRGYDQALLIARELARQRQLPCQTLLRRQGHSRQLGANRQQRQQQLKEAFYCPYPERVRGRQVVLVDDVLTTGATIEAAARVLRAAGATGVSAALFAQKI